MGLLGTFCLILLAMIVLANILEVITSLLLSPFKWRKENAKREHLRKRQEYLNAVLKSSDAVRALLPRLEKLPQSKEEWAQYYWQLCQTRAALEEEYALDADPRTEEHISGIKQLEQQLR